MKFDEITAILNERAEDRYVHNTSMKNLYGILERGKLVGKRQVDGASPRRTVMSNGRHNIHSAPELCFSRSDMAPQNTGVCLSPHFSFGDLVKIQLKMNNITDGKLRIKKPYPVSFGNFYHNKEILDELSKLNSVLKNRENKKKIRELSEYFRTRTTYTRLHNSKERKFNIDENKLFSILDSVLESPEIEKYINSVKNVFKRRDEEETGEERLTLDNNKSIPVKSRYMTINIPEKRWNDQELKKYRAKYKDDQGLFRTYEDPSHRARAIHKEHKQAMLNKEKL